MPISQLAESSLQDASTLSNDRRLSDQPNPAETLVSLLTNSSPHLSRSVDRKFSLPASVNSASSTADDDDDSVYGIQSAISAHQTRSQSLAALKTGSGTNSLKIHIARPWLKKKAALVEESSEEEIERVCQSLQGALRAHEKRKLTLERLEADADLFTVGKVSALRQQFNDRRKANRSAAERSDGITDDDEDVVY